MTPSNEDIKAILDIATGSMDFSSGFLDHEEVATLRRVAEMIDVDPIEVTPSEWRRQYAHAFLEQTKPAMWDHYHPTSAWEDQLRSRGCSWCASSAEDAIHHGVSTVATGIES